MLAHQSAGTSATRRAQPGAANVPIADYARHVVGQLRRLLGTDRRFGIRWDLVSDVAGAIV